MANIPIRDIPGAVVASPDPSNLIPMDNGSLMQKTTIANAVNTTLPLSSQVEAQAGVDNVKRMSPLRTKQAIDAQTPAIVNTAITSLNLGTMSQEDTSDYTPTSGLAAVALSNDYEDLSNLPTLGTMSQETASDYTKTSGLAAVALSNDYSDLDNLPTLGSAAATDASDYATAAQGALADTAIQPGNAALVPAGGTIGQVLVKNSGTNYDTGWVSSASATAVSYAPQTLTGPQQAQARTNIDALGSDIFSALTAKTTPVDADAVLIADSAALDAPKKLTFANMWTWISGKVLTLFNASGSAPVYACRAWVSFDGVGTVAIRGSANVSSITDNGTGDYTVNFTTAMPDVNYCIVGSASANLDPMGGAGFSVSSRSAATNLVGSVRVVAGIQNGFYDVYQIHVAIIR